MFAHRRTAMTRFSNQCFELSVLRAGCNGMLHRRLPARTWVLRTLLVSACVSSHAQLQREAFGLAEASEMWFILVSHILRFRFVFQMTIFMFYSGFWSVFLPLGHGQAGHCFFTFEEIDCCILGQSIKSDFHYLWLTGVEQSTRSLSLHISVNFAMFAKFELQSSVFCSA